MNKLHTNFNGKFPFFLDDWRFQMDAIIEAVNALASVFTNQQFPDETPEEPYADGFIISGCGISFVGPIVTVAPGFVIIGGEVRYFAGDSADSSLGAVRIVAADYTDLSMTKIMGDSSLVNPYEKRLAVLVTEPPFPSPFTPGINVVLDGSYEYRSPNLALREALGCHVKRYASGGSHDIYVNVLNTRAVNIHGAIKVQGNTSTDILTISLRYSPITQYGLITTAVDEANVGSTVIQVLRTTSPDEVKIIHRGDLKEALNDSWYHFNLTYASLNG